MKQIISRLRSVGLRQIITVFLATLTFLVIPAFSHSALLQAQAAELRNPGEYNPVTPDTVERIKEKAEDFSDTSEKAVANTGLENIKQLGEKIPKAIELNARQAGSVYNPNEPNKMEAMERDQKIVESK
jgi:hypothetical protein